MRVKGEMAFGAKVKRKNLLEIAAKLVFINALSCGTAVSVSALANPMGGTVAAGNATILQTSPNRLDIQQNSQRVVLDWRTFNLSKDDHTNFNQPSSSSIALNRINDPNPSAIHGKLTANGNVYLLNPSGIMFGPDATVDVGGLVATTSHISNKDFMNGNMHFTSDGVQPTAKVINHGVIRIGDGGKLVLAAPSVENRGVIEAKLSKVVLASGTTFTLNLEGDSLFQLDITPELEDAGILQNGVLVAQNGQIFADGGTVLLTAEAAKRLSQGIVVGGNIRTLSVSETEGEITIGSGGGRVIVSGQLDASGVGKNEVGGRITVTGEQVGISENAVVNASGGRGGGSIRIGGDFHGSNPDTKNARRTYIGSKATIKADALEEGDGGGIVVWSNEHTQFFGTISAMGGAKGGDGGVVEVSGAQNMSFCGKVDLSARDKMGTLLLDPTNIEVATGGAAGSGDVDAFADPGATVVIDPTALDLVAGNIILQAENNIEFKNELTLKTNNASLTAQAGNDITVNAKITTTGGNINFTANDAGGKQTGTGSININSELDTSKADGGNISLKVQGGTGNINIGSNVTAANADILLDGPVRLTGNVAVSGRDISFKSTVDADLNVNDRTLNISSTAIVDFMGSVGRQDALQSLTVTTANTTNFNGDIDLRSGGLAVTSNAINLNGSVDTTDSNTGGNITFTGPVTLGSNVTLLTDGSGGDGNISFSSTVDADLNTNNRTLAATAGTGTVGFGGAIGIVQALQSLTVNSAATTTFIGNIDLRSGGLAVTSNAINLNGSVDTTDSNAGGNITFTGPVTLGSNVTLLTDGSGGDGNISFSSTVDADLNTNNRTLAATAGTGTVGFGGAIGIVQALQSLTVNSAATTTFMGNIDLGSGGLAVTSNAINLNGSVDTKDGNTGGAITFNGPVILGANVILMTDGSNGGGSVSFSSTVDADTVANMRTLGVSAGNANVVFNGMVGKDNALQSLAVNSGTTTFNGNVNLQSGGLTVTSDVIDLNGAKYDTTLDGMGGVISLTGQVILGNNVTLFTDGANGDGNVSILTPLEINGRPIYTTILDADDPDNNRTMLIMPGSAIVDINSGIGQNKPLQSLTISSSSKSNFKGNVYLGGGGLTVVSDEINMNGWSDLVTKETAMTVDTTKNGNIGGNVILDGKVVLGANVDMQTNSDNDGKIKFTSTVDADVNTNARTLKITAGDGPVDFDGSVGILQALQSLTVVSASTTTFMGNVDLRSGGLTVNSNKILLNGNVDTTDDPTGGNMILDGSLILGANVLLKSDSNADGNIDFVKTVDADLNINNRSLGIMAGSGAVTFGGDVGLNSALQSLTVDSASTTTFKGNVRLRSGGLNVTSSTASLLNGSFDTTDDGNGGNITFTGPVLLGANVGMNTAGSNSAGEVIFNGGVNKNPLAASGSLTIRAIKDVVTNSDPRNDITFNEAVGNDSSVDYLDVSGHNITIQKNVSSGGDVTLNNMSTQTIDPYACVSPALNDGKLSVNGAINLSNGNFLQGGNGPVYLGATLNPDYSQLPGNINAHVKTNGGSITFKGPVRFGQQTAIVSQGGNISFCSFCADNPANNDGTLSLRADSDTTINGGTIKSPSTRRPYLDVYDINIGGTKGSFDGVVTRFPAGGQTTATAIWDVWDPARRHSGFFLNGYPIGPNVIPTDEITYDARDSTIPLPMGEFVKRIVFTEDNAILFNAMENSELNTKIVEEINSVKNVSDSGSKKLREDEVESLDDLSSSYGAPFNYELSKNILITSPYKQPLLQHSLLKDVLFKETKAVELAQLYYKVLNNLNVDANDYFAESLINIKNSLIENVVSSFSKLIKNERGVLFFSGHGLIHKDKQQLMMSDSLLPYFNKERAGHDRLLSTVDIFKIKDEDNHGKIAILEACHGGAGLMLGNSNENKKIYIETITSVDWDEQVYLQAGIDLKNSVTFTLLMSELAMAERMQQNTFLTKKALKKVRDKMRGIILFRYKDFYDHTPQDNYLVKK